MAESPAADATVRIQDETVATNDETPDTTEESVEERSFSAALICLEGHFTQSPPMGPQTATRVSSIISKTLEKTHTVRKARYVPESDPTLHRRQLNKKGADRSLQRGTVQECGNLDLADEDFRCFYSYLDSSLSRSIVEFK